MFLKSLKDHSFKCFQTATYLDVESILVFFFCIGSFAGENGGTGPS